MVDLLCSETSYLPADQIHEDQGRYRFKWSGREIYFYCPDHDNLLTQKLFDPILGVTRIHGDTVAVLSCNQEDDKLKIDLFTFSADGKNVRQLDGKLIVNETHLPTAIQFNEELNRVRLVFNHMVYRFWRESWNWLFIERTQWSIVAQGPILRT